MSAGIEPGAPPGGTPPAPPGVQGLTSAEAAARLARWGPNELAPPRRLAALRDLGRSLANPLVLLLLGASGLSAWGGQLPSAAIIALMILLSVALNAAQAARSQRAARRLREAVSHRATVVRDGLARDLPAVAVVPGDVIQLAAGDLVPADARLLEARDLFVNEAALTGESLPVDKHADPDGAAGAPEGRGGQRRSGVVYQGTSVVSGRGLALVVATGAGTEFARIAARLEARPPETEFERGTRRFGFLILELVAALVVFAFFVNTALHRDPLESLLFAVALAVGMTPELLPMIVSITLASGAVRMARRRVIVRRLAAIENFGSMDVLCSDKTGTLTVGEIHVHRHVNLAGAEDEEVIRLAALNSGFQTGLRSPMDEAILRHPHPDLSRFRRVDEIPFDFVRRRVSVVVVDEGGRRLLVTKGAPEGILALATAVRAGPDAGLQDPEHGSPARDPEGFKPGAAPGPLGTRPLDPAARARAEALFRALSAEGYRVLAVAFRPVAPAPAYTAADERELVLAGFAAFLDPPLPGVAETLATLRADGVAVKILTGDHELVAQQVCAQVGLPTVPLVRGDEIDRMTDPALAAVAERTAIFARVSPAQKTRIVQALRARGHVVGVLGDGINDAPALRAADVGISVENAVDVAREAADIVLLEKRLAVLHEGVVQGRRSFGNVMKYILMGTSSNFGNMLSMAAASAVLPFLPMLPLQILLNNLLYDVSQVAIPADRVDRTYLLKPRRWDVALIRRYMLLMGPLSSLFDLLTFGLLLGVFRAGPALFRTGWFVESLATQTLVIFVIRTAERPWRSRPSPALTANVLGSLALGTLLPASPLAPWLGFQPLPLPVVAALTGMILAYLAVVEAVKGWVIRWHPRCTPGDAGDARRRQG